MKKCLSFASILHNGITKDNIKEVLNKLLESDLLLPLNENKVVFLSTDENKEYIPLFTDESQIKNIEYTSLDKVQILKIIKEIYDTGHFYAISINPFTDDFILNDNLINLIKSIMHINL